MSVGVGEKRSSKSRAGALRGGREHTHLALRVEVRHCDAEPLVGGVQVCNILMYSSRVCVVVLERLVVKLERLQQRRRGVCDERGRNAEARETRVRRELAERTRGYAASSR